MCSRVFRHTWRLITTNFHQSFIEIDQNSLYSSKSCKNILRRWYFYLTCGLEEYLSQHLCMKTRKCFSEYQNRLNSKKIVFFAAKLSMGTEVISSIVAIMWLCTRRVAFSWKVCTVQLLTLFPILDAVFSVQTLADSFHLLPLFILLASIFSIYN